MGRSVGAALIEEGAVIRELGNFGADVARYSGVTNSCTAKGEADVHQYKYLTIPDYPYHPLEILLACTG
jgi:hypothetical protein